MLLGDGATLFRLDIFGGVPQGVVPDCGAVKLSNRLFWLDCDFPSGPTNLL